MNPTAKKPTYSTKSDNTVKTYDIRFQVSASLNIKCQLTIGNCTRMNVDEKLI